MDEVNISIATACLSVDRHQPRDRPRPHACTPAWGRRAGKRKFSLRHPPYLGYIHLAILAVASGERLVADMGGSSNETFPFCLRSYCACTSYLIGDVKISPYFPTASISITLHKVSGVKHRMGRMLQPQPKYPCEASMRPSRHL